MKYYPPILVILRFLSVCLMLFFLFRFFDLWLTLTPGAGMGLSDMEKFIEFNRDQLMMKSIFGTIGGALLYGLAPFLARIIVLGADRNLEEN